MIYIAICEDEKAEQVKLLRSLEDTKLFSKTKVDFFDNGQLLVDKYKSKVKYDFVFLDVDMPSMNGIETGKIINSIDPDAIIIFVTSYPQFAIDAFDCNAFNYLLKTCSKDKFDAVIFKAFEKYKTYHQVYPITTKEGKYKLKVSDIYYIECCKKHIYFHMNNHYYVTNQTLGEVYNALAPFGFCQVHQGYLVNLEKVVAVYGNDIILDNQQKVMISVRKHTEVVKAYSEYLERCM